MPHLIMNSRLTNLNFANLEDYPHQRPAPWWRSQCLQEYVSPTFSAESSHCTRLARLVIPFWGWQSDLLANLLKDASPSKVDLLSTTHWFGPKMEHTSLGKGTWRARKLELSPSQLQSLSCDVWANQAPCTSQWVPWLLCQHLHTKWSTPWLSDFAATIQCLVSRSSYFSRAQTLHLSKLRPFPTKSIPNLDPEHCHLYRFMTPYLSILRADFANFWIC